MSASLENGQTLPGFIQYNPIESSFLIAPSNTDNGLFAVKITANFEGFEES